MMTVRYMVLHCPHVASSQVHDPGHERLHLQLPRTRLRCPSGCTADPAPGGKSGPLLGSRVTSRSGGSCPECSSRSGSRTILVTCPLSSYCSRPVGAFDSYGNAPRASGTLSAT